jgi:demethylmacrocin O-methyltransferase
MNLIELAIKHKSDKHGHHDYCRYYQRHFEHLKDKPIRVLELGVGGYEFKDRGGSGLRMWGEFFSNGQIFGLDLYDKSGIQLPANVTIFQGSQADDATINDIAHKCGDFDIIIDDASHINKLTIHSFTLLWPHLKRGGIYVIEDLESSWWNEHGFDGEPDYKDMAAKTSINYLRILINDVNAKHLPAGNFLPIESMHFYQNICFIIKK